MGIAVAGHNYATILNGKVHWIFTAAQLGAWNDAQITVVDITAVSPVPEPGWDYSGTGFAAPAAPVVTWAQYQAQARQALAKSDVTVLRCAENGVAVPADWAAYRVALRAIVAAASGTPGTLPALPAYPAGT